MEKIIDEVLTEIDKIQEGEATMDKIASTMNSVIDKVSGITQVVARYVDNSRLAEKPKKELSAFWEYFGFYIVLFLTVGAGFGYFTPILDWGSIVKLALILSTAVLIGFIKQMLWTQISKRNDTIESLRMSLRAKDTALSASSIEYSRLSMKYRKVVEYIKTKEPGFRTDILFYPKYYTENEHPKPITGTDIIKHAPPPFPPIQKEEEKNEKTLF